MSVKFVSATTLIQIGGVEIELHSFFTSTLTEESAPLLGPAVFTSCYTLKRRLFMSQPRSGRGDQRVERVPCMAYRNIKSGIYFFKTKKLLFSNLNIWPIRFTLFGRSIIII
jgi:hypothetical protein